MRQKSLKFLFFFTILVFCASNCSCSVVDRINEKYYDYISRTYQSGFHEDVGNSIELLNQAFNATVNADNEELCYDFSKSNCHHDEDKRIDIKRNIYSLNSMEGITPSTGNVKGLVIPVDFIDYPIENKIYSDIVPSYQSVHSYYYNTSYGKLNLTFDILPWYRMSKRSTYYETLDTKYYGDVPGVSAIIHEVLSAINHSTNFKKYDSNNDGMIDCLYIIYSRPIDYANGDFWWAYQYYNLDEVYYDDTIPFSYVFAGFNFLFEDKLSCNTTTYIHETGHLFGIEDYYDYDFYEGTKKGGLGGYDIMDGNYGDHNPFSKLLVGWIKNPLLITLEPYNEITIPLHSFSLTGDTIIIADSFDESKGVFQSYFLLQYLDNDFIINKDRYAYINNDGIRAFRVNAQTILTYNNNESIKYEELKYDNSYTEYNLIDALNNNLFYPLYTKNENNSDTALMRDLFLENSTMPAFLYSNSTLSEYGFNVTDINSNTKTASIRIFRR